MNRKICFIALLVLMVPGISGCGYTSEVSEAIVNNDEKVLDDRERVYKLGWVIFWPKQNKSLQSLLRKEILDKHNIKMQFDGVSSVYFDKTFLGKQDIVVAPAGVLMEKIKDSDKWEVIAKRGYYPVSVNLVANSQLRTLKDLKGGRVLIYPGTGLNYEVRRILKKEGLEPGVDVLIEEIRYDDIFDEVARVSKGASDEKTAFAGISMDLFPVESIGAVRSIATSSTINLIMAKRDFLENNPGIVLDFLKVVKEDIYYFNQDDNAKTHFLNLIHTSIANEVLQRYFEVDPNYNKKSYDEIDFSFSESDMGWLQGLLNFVGEGNKNFEEMCDFQYIDIIK